MNDHLPRETMRGLALLFVLTTETATHGARKAWRKVRKSLEPPSDLRVVSDSGHEYTGVLLVQDNEVRAGLVSRTARATQDSTPVSRPALAGPSPAWSSGHEDDDCRLPSWADDTRGGHRW